MNVLGGNFPRLIDVCLQLSRALIAFETDEG